MSVPQNVVSFDQSGKTVTLVGTAHVSQKSVEEVRRVIREVQPHTVCVELDAARYEALVDGQRWRRLDVFQVIRQRRVLYLLANLALSAYQRKIGERLGIRPGAELLAAVEEAREQNAALVLADRDIQITLKRAWANLSWMNKARLATALAATPFLMEELTEERVEELKDRDTISEMLNQLADAMPGLREPLIDERDQFLVSKIIDAPGTRIVAVVGAGHVSGMLAQRGMPVDRERICRIPRPSVTPRILGWMIAVAILGAFWFGWRNHSHESLNEMLRAWILPTSLGCGLLTAAARGHPFTIVCGILAAPLTTLNPLVGVGMVTGLVEAWVRKPRVSDCEAIPDDVLSWRGWFRNRATRVLMVFLLSSLGASLGMVVGVTWVLSLLR